MDITAMIRVCFDFMTKYTRKMSLQILFVTLDIILWISYRLLIWYKNGEQSMFIRRGQQEYL